MVTSGSPGLEKKPERPQITSCFLHQFLDKQRKHGKGKTASPADIAGDQPQDKALAALDGVHSRLLTKRQLLEMAGEIRDLSKKLGTLRLKLHVKTVFLFVRSHYSTLEAEPETDGDAFAERGSQCVLVVLVIKFC